MLFSLGMIYMLIMFLYSDIFIIFISMMIMMLLVYFLSISSLCSVNMFCMNISHINVDMMSFVLVLLSMFILVIVFVNNYINKDVHLYSYLILMMFSLLFCFFSCNLIYFYVFFEFSMIPLFFMIMGQGYNMERFNACLYIMLYTLMSSFLFLILLMLMSCDSFIFLEKKLLMFFCEEGVMWVLMIIVFLVKMPMYFLHSWLSKAHVEASVGGSMLLAGVLLKLGCFGVYRIMYYINFNSFYFLMKFLLVFSLMGAIFSSIICMRQIDIKMLIAYSSVSHMGILLSGMLSMVKLGWCGTFGMMLGHGLCSSCLFYIANIIYIRLHSRNMLVLKSVFNIYPGVYFFWLIFSLINMGSPPFINFFSEMMLLISIMKMSLFMFIFVLFYLMMVVYYGLCLFLRLGHGFYNNLCFMKKESFLEMFVVFIHFLFSMLFMFSPNLFFMLNF